MRDEPFIPSSLFPSSSYLRTLVLRTLPGTVAGRLRGWRIRRLIANYETRVVQHEYGDASLKVELRDPLSEGWYDHDWAQLPEIPALRGRSLRAGATVFDLGAHHGVVAMMLAREVGPEGRIVAVEANPHNAAAADRNRALNDMQQITILQRAVSDRSGPITFNEGLNGQLDDGRAAGGRITVQSLTLDDLVDEYGMPDVVFLDVEGAECRVLEGGPRVLSAAVDFAVEVHVNVGLEKLGGSVERLLGYFPPEGFDVSIRSERDDRFGEFVDDDRRMADRFFLLARTRSR